MFESLLEQNLSGQRRVETMVMAKGAQNTLWPSR